MADTSEGITTRRVGKVLLVNAEPEVNRILQINLGYANLDVISAVTGQEALD